MLLKGLGQFGQRRQSRRRGMHLVQDLQADGLDSTRNSLASSTTAFVPPTEIGRR